MHRGGRRFVEWADRTPCQGIGLWAALTEQHRVEAMADSYGLSSDRSPSRWFGLVRPVPARGISNDVLKITRRCYKAPFRSKVFDDGRNARLEGGS